MKRRALFVGTVVGLTFAAPAQADDWTLLCTFGDGIETIIEYDAGWPQYTVAVTRGGRTLNVMKALPAGRISNESEMLLFVNREAEPKQERKLLIRLNNDTMRAKLEAGSGGFDYVALSGTCREL